MEMITSRLIAWIVPRFFVTLMVTLIAAPTLGQANLSGVTWEQRLEVASGGGYRGPWRMNESEFHYVDDPTVAINEQGIIGVAWADQSRKDIFLQVYEPNGKKRFEQPVNVSKSPRIFSWLPRMLIAPGDASEVYILWQEIVFSGGSHGGEIFFARSTDGGKTFSDSVNLSNTIAGAGKGRLTRHYWHNGSLDLAVGPEGNLYAAWTEYEGALRFSRSADRGGSFSDPLHIAGNNAVPGRGPSVVTGADGTVYLAWTVGENRAADIHFATSVDRGRSFREPRIVFKSGGHSDAPKIAVDGKGTVHLVYADSPAGPFEGYHIRYMNSSDGGRTFEKPKEISSPHTEQLESVNFPALALDGAANVYATWELFPRRGEWPQGIGFAYSSDGGTTFVSPSIVPGTADPALGFNGSQQGLLMRKLAVNRAGAVAIVNSTFKWKETSHIWLFRGRAGGH